jgi:hypothetical protein
MTSQGGSTYASKQRGPGMPGMRGLDHFGLTVPDMEQAVDFFCDVQVDRI